MARESKDTVEYFPFKVQRGRTIKTLISKYGKDGFCFIYNLFRVLAKEPGHFIDIRNEFDMEFLAQECMLDRISVTEMLADLVSWGKLDQAGYKNGIVWYQGFVNELKWVYDKRKRDLPTLKMAYEKLGISVTETTPNPIFLAQECDSGAISAPEMRQRKVKEKKEIINKKENINNLPPPSAPPRVAAAVAVDENLEEAKKICDMYCQYEIEQRRNTPRRVVSQAGFRRDQWDRYVGNPDRNPPIVANPEERMNLWLDAVGPMWKKEKENAEIRAAYDAQIEQERIEREQKMGGMAA